MISHQKSYKIMINHQESNKIIRLLIIQEIKIYQSIVLCEIELILMERIILLFKNLNNNNLYIINN